MRARPSIASWKKRSAEASARSRLSAETAPSARRTCHRPVVTVFFAGTTTAATSSQLATQKVCEIVGGHLMPDHVPMMIVIPPKLAVSQVVGYLKDKSAIHLARVYGERKRNFVGQHFWARGYVVSTVGRDEAPSGLTFAIRRRRMRGLTNSVSGAPSRGRESDPAAALSGLSTKPPALPGDIYSRKRCIKSATSSGC